MVRLCTTFGMGTIMTPEIAAKLSQKSTQYTSVIMLEFNGRTVHLDSLIGILAQPLARGMEIAVVAEGSDEQAAAEAVRDMLSKA